MNKPNRPRYCSSVGVDVQSYRFTKQDAYTKMLKNIYLTLLCFLFK